VTERPARCPTHPGELLREILADALKLPVAAAARQLGVSRMTLHRFLRGEQAVTPEMALRLGHDRPPRPRPLPVRLQLPGRQAGERLRRDLAGIR
jgi:addiction module HigA family antidote